MARPLVGAERVREAIDHHFGHPVAYRALDDGRGELDLLLLGLAGGLAQALDQSPLFGLGSGCHADIFLGFLSLLESGFLPNLGSVGDEIVEGGHG
ncbi:hypothetical protein ACVWZ4_006852 [Bradyrhizobium sp. USDA 4472]